jgi:glycolate oxidase iron-sulfur subunit
MKTGFSSERLAGEPALREVNSILRKCVHCGFCTATCPTFVLTGDEADSPRGRIYLIKAMLEEQAPPPPSTVTHIDRCLTCLSCMTTCPSGVDYVHLIDRARSFIAKHHKRSLPDRLLRKLLAMVIPHPLIFRLSLWGAKLGKPLAGLMPGRLKGLMAMAPEKIHPASPTAKPQNFPAQGERKKRVALLVGCAQQVLRPAIDEATIRLLTRLGCEVVTAAGQGCCGALVHHMGDEEAARRAARKNVAAWMKEINGKGLDAIVSNASGCGTMLKDYHHLLAGDQDAETISTLAKDISEILNELGPLVPTREVKMSVAYHSACSLQHGQKIRDLPKQLLASVGFTIKEIGEGHLCCGSAGTYNILEPEMAKELQERKAGNIEKTKADLVAAGNIGCIEQISRGANIPVVHTVELLDWATGGPNPTTSPSSPLIAQ